MKKKIIIVFNKRKYSIRYVLLFLTFFCCNSVSNAQNQFEIKLFLQGYYTGSNTMRPVLYNQCVAGGGSPASCLSLFPLTEVDDIIVELHSATLPYNIVPGLTYTCRLQTTGLCSFNAPSGSYYIAILYPSAIQTWSHDPVQIDATHLFYDFSLSANKAFGDNQSRDYFSPISGNLVNDAAYKILMGDVSDPNFGFGFQDGISESTDFNDMENEVYFGVQGLRCGNLISDLNGDGCVDLLDFIIIENSVYNIYINMIPN